MLKSIAQTIALVSGLAIAAPALADPWSGPYAGLSIGTARSSAIDLDRTGANCWWCTNDYGAKSHTFFGGGQVGYNFHSGHIVYGLEGEVGGGLLKSSANDPTFTYPGYQVKDSLYGAVTGRLGVAWGNTLIYGKAGYGIMGADFNWADQSYSSSASTHRTLSGLVFGGGAEYSISRALSLTAEYEHLGFSNSTTVMNVAGYCCGYQQTIQVKPIDIFKVGINVHFNSPN